MKIEERLQPDIDIESLAQPLLDEILSCANYFQSPRIDIDTSDHCTLESEPTGLRSPTSIDLEVPPGH